MNFESFWKLIQKCNETELVTLYQKKPFSFKYDVSHNSVEIIPNSKSPRASEKIKFEKVWDIAKQSLSPFSVNQYSGITFNSSYIVAIMKYFLNDDKIN
jgi:hypothetical protein